MQTEPTGSSDPTEPASEPAWEPAAHHRVVIIGAGFGGIGLAVRLRRAGIASFVVLEKADRIGGTWRDNTYPGAACDVPSHLYSYPPPRSASLSS